MTSWRELRGEAAGCTRCDLYQRATQTIFGEGPASAADLFRKAQADSRKGAEMGRQLLRSRLAS